ncbi:putative multiple sugar transport system permease protein [Sporomusaceae bacterium BoRhaA]|uniref:multiple monosaccharide ABC transporter permease n=1 Tax=Pelorhabdus rhamnosifermentans TaxID=2772457 RepID=UPI001C061DAB|nr:multiple monosaccharide ABC transporter permease [Pelorhabdus rhamnosifermentans]MBU2701427.1 putative multiple sugar transport system permease protein [Pelorhabdus rhamnosifermentans]
METLKHMFQNNIREYGMVIALVSVMAFFEIVSQGTLLMPLNVTNLIQQNSYILILAIGMLLVIVAFQIDLSVGSIAAFIGAISAILMVDYHVGVVAGVVISLIVGGLAGAWHGYWISYFRIPAFIATLAGMLLFRGLTMTALQGQSKGPFPVSFQKISNGFIPDFFSGTTLHITTLLVGVILTLIYIYFELSSRSTKKKYNFHVIPLQFSIAKMAIVGLAINWFMYLLAAYKGIPNVLILLFVLIVFYTFITTKTVLGRHIYAVGGNEKAAKLSGVKNKRIVFWVFVNMGVLSALSGLVFAARLNAATPKAGTGFELDAIAACFIGGASTAGGIGAVMGAIIGGLVMGVMNNGMSLMGVTIDMQQTIKGLVVLLAVAFDIYTKSKQS